MNLIGKLINNRYEILEKIGNGGMATVYKAKCHVLNRFVAVKILRDEFTTDSEFIKRFNSEAQSAASLTHPNIVSIFDVGAEDNLYYIVMELIQGKTLKDIITEDGKLSWKWSLNIAIQIASALETAHKNNIIHRDIKPHNIIITEDGIAKVTDFGIAKAVSNSTITAFGTTIGSVHYFSPEHARGGFTDAKSDLYSLGVVMYEMLTGRVPFDADTPVSVALKQVQEEPVEPIVYNPEIPVSVNRIILKAMQKDPNMRYQSATEMIDDLSMALKKPTENFVVINSDVENSPTQRVPIVSQDETDNKKTTLNNNTENKEGNFLDKVKDFYIKYPFMKTVTFLGVLILIFVIVALIVMFTVKKSQVPEAYIPKLVASKNETGDFIESELITEEEAIRELEKLGFTNYVITRKTDEKVKEGYVIKQTPDRYDILYNVNKKIELVVSTGPEIVTLPEKMVGQLVDDVLVKLDKIGVIYEITEEVNEEIEKGTILEVDPLEGTQIEKKNPIKIKVSSGPAPSILPEKIIGEQVDVIIAALAPKASYEVIVSDDKTLNEANEQGIVVDYTLVDYTPNDPGNREVPVDVLIRLVISTGPERVQIPNIKAGSKLDKVKEDLEKAGLQYEEKREYHDGFTKDSVIELNPKSGEEVAKNQKVTIIVSDGPQPIVPKNLVGKKLSEVKKELNEKKIEFTVTPEGAKDDYIVKSLTPGEGAKLDKNAKVTITVEEPKPVEHTAKFKINVKSYMEKIGLGGTESGEEPELDDITVKIKFKIGDKTIEKETKATNENFEFSYKSTGSKVCVVTLNDSKEIYNKTIDFSKDLDIKLSDK